MNVNHIIKEQSSLLNKQESLIQELMFDNWKSQFDLASAKINQQVIQNANVRDRFRNFILSEELDQIKKNEPESFITTIINLLNLFCLFPDNDLIKRFSELGCSKSTLRFLVPHRQIMTEIMKINTSKNIRIDPQLSLKLIIPHFILKIANSVLLDHNMVGKKRSGGIYNDMHNSLFDHFKRKSYSEKNDNDHSKELDKELTKVFNHPEFDDLAPHKLKFEALTSIQGKTEKNTLGVMLNSCILWSCSERHLYIELFDFFKILMPDINLLSEQEFIDDKNSGRYDGKYDTYKFKTLKKILTSTSTKQLF